MAKTGFKMLHSRWPLWGARVYPQGRGGPGSGGALAVGGRLLAPSKTADDVS